MSTLRTAILLVALVLIQAWILNSMTLWGYALPMLYIYLLIGLPASYNRCFLLLWAFVLGISVDAFSNTYGVNASATVFVAFVRPYLQKLFFAQEDFSDLPVSISTLHTNKFYKYAISVVLVHHTVFFLIEYLSFFNPLLLLLRILCSSTFTMLLIVGLENLFYKKRYK